MKNFLTKLYKKLGKLKDDGINAYDVHTHLRALNFVAMVVFTLPMVIMARMAYVGHTSFTFDAGGTMGFVITVIVLLYFFSFCCLYVFGTSIRKTIQPSYEINLLVFNFFYYLSQTGIILWLVMFIIFFFAGNQSQSLFAALACSFFVGSLSGVYMKHYIKHTQSARQ